MSTSRPKFELRALIIIVPFAAAFLFGMLCICRHKIFLWTLRKEDPKAGAPGEKLDGARARKGSGDAETLPAPADTEAGNRGAESESDSSLIAQAGKGGHRKSFCT